MRREKVQTSQPKATVHRIETPKVNDILLGRGKGFTSHVGNIQLRKLVMDNLAIYESASYTEKQYVSEGIVRLVHKQGGLFLKEDETWWIEVDGETARNKVCEQGHSC